MYCYLENDNLAPPVRKALVAVMSERDEHAEICRDGDGNPEPDSELRDFELVPLSEDWKEYFDCEVKPFAADAWVDESYATRRTAKSDV
jgi:type I restriction enzyme M protein